MARSPLFSQIRRCIRRARVANRHDASVDELLERGREDFLMRRRFLQATALAALAPPLAWARRERPKAERRNARVVIVGAGIAGLQVGHCLKKAGVRAVIYDAAGRTGGRIRSAHNLMGPGLTTELGGEFIDSGHDDMLALAREFALPLLDLQIETGLTHEAYYFGGRLYTEAQLIEEFRPLAAQMEADLALIGDTVNYRSSGEAIVFDRLSIAQYLERIGARGWLCDLLEVAYVTEYGLEAAEQSALNLLFLIGTDVSQGFEIFGESDERYKIEGGNSRVTQALTQALDDRLKLEHRLEAIESKRNRFRLTFAHDGSTRSVDADFVVLCIPFSVLREVELDLPLPAVKRKAITELGYGTNSKLLLGVDTRVWQRAGFVGKVFSDERFQSGWDNSAGQAGDAGGFTCYLGGRTGMAVGAGTAQEQAARFIPGIEKVFPGMSAARNHRVVRVFWPGSPFTQGSYACYKPGQWTGIAGAEIEPVGRLLFAGEHCSADFQGYMNGGAETGRVAAETLLTMLGHAARKETL